MTPEAFSRAIVSIERNYGLKLDARSTWFRLDEFKKVKELKGGKCNEKTGWYGLLGGCKRGRTYEAESKRIASKRAISRKIRNRKGMGPKSRPAAFQYKKVKELGSGAYGVAVLTDRGTVVKTATGFGSMVGAARSEFEGLMQLEKLGIGPKAIALHGSTIEMGLIKGKTIDAISREGASTVVHQANQMKAANALLELHKSGWTHGDAHLQNILIDEYGAAKIIDAGRATKIGRSNFSTGYHDMMGALKDHPALESLTEALKDPLESFKKETLEAFSTRDRNQVTPGGTVALRKLHKSYLGVAEQFIK